MKSRIYTALGFILNWYFLTSGVIVSSVFFDKLFYDSKTMIIPPVRFIGASVLGLIASIYFTMSDRKKTD